jgi:hypothetical protein
MKRDSSSCSDGELIKCNNPAPPVREEDFKSFEVHVETSSTIMVRAKDAEEAISKARSGGYGSTESNRSYKARRVEEFYE